MRVNVPPIAVLWLLQSKIQAAPLTRAHRVRSADGAGKWRFKQTSRAWRAQVLHANESQAADGVNEASRRWLLIGRRVSNEQWLQQEAAPLTTPVLGTRITARFASFTLKFWSDKRVSSWHVAISHCLIKSSLSKPSSPLSRITSQHT